jgi:hypothetical protein
MPANEQGWMEYEIGSIAVTLYNFLRYFLPLVTATGLIYFSNSVF